MTDEQEQRDKQFYECPQCRELHPDTVACRLPNRPASTAPADRVTVVCTGCGFWKHTIKEKADPPSLSKVTMAGCPRCETGGEKDLHEKFYDAEGRLLDSDPESSTFGEPASTAPADEGQPIRSELTHKQDVSLTHPTLDWEMVKRIEDNLAAMPDPPDERLEKALDRFHSSPCTCDKDGVEHCEFTAARDAIFNLFAREHRIREGNADVAKRLKLELDEADSRITELEQERDEAVDDINRCSRCCKEDRVCLCRECRRDDMADRPTWDEVRDLLAAMWAQRDRWDDDGYEAADRLLADREKK